MEQFRPLPRSISTCPKLKGHVLHMVGASDGPETVFLDDDGYCAFWATTYRMGHHSQRILLREGGTGKVLLFACHSSLCQKVPLSWEVRAANGEAIVTVQAKRRRKYGAAQYKLTVCSAHRTQTAIKIKPDLSDPQHLVLWSVTGSKQKAEDGAEMCSALYSSFSSSLPRGMHAARTAAAAAKAGPRPSSSSSSGSSSARGGQEGSNSNSSNGSSSGSSVVPSPPGTPGEAGSTAEVGDAVAEELQVAAAETEEKAGGAVGVQEAVAEEIEAATSAASEEGEERQQQAASAVAGAPEKEKAVAAAAAPPPPAAAAAQPEAPGTPPVEEEEKGAGAAKNWSGKAKPLREGLPGAVAAEEPPGDCCLELHPRANAPLVCCLLAIHRMLLSPDSLWMDGKGLFA